MPLRPRTDRDIAASPPDPTALEALRGATRASHASLDGFLEQHAAFRSLDGYVRFLQGMHRLHQVHRWLYATSDEELLRLLPASPVHAIETDLIALEAQIPERIERSADRRRDDAHAWGCAYVLLGAHLGSKEILARLGHSGMERLPLRFLHHCRDHAVCWRPFVDALNARPWSREEIKIMRQSAIAVFDRAIEINRDLFGRKSA